MQTLPTPLYGAVQHPHNSFIGEGVVNFKGISDLSSDSSEGANGVPKAERRNMPAFSDKMGRVPPRCRRASARPPARPGPQAEMKCPTPTRYCLSSSRKAGLRWTSLRGKCDLPRSLLNRPQSPLAALHSEVDQAVPANPRSSRELSPSDALVNARHGNEIRANTSPVQIQVNRTRRPG
jgi:hypothetical protein